MRNLFLSLVLANLLLLAWQFWVDPSPPAAINNEADGLALFGARQAPVRGPAPSRPEPAPVAGAGPVAPPAGTCFRLGPLPDSTAAQQAARSLAGRGIDATPIARDAQLWLGHWVQIAGFDSVAAAETARERLVAGGIADALLMQDGPRPLISLGVFRERDRADRVAAAARNLGFEVELRDRYRPGVEQWLLVRPRTGQEIRPAEISLAGGRIMRAEAAPCDGAEGAMAPAEGAPEGPAAGVPPPGVAEEPL